MKEKVLKPVKWFLKRLDHILPPVLFFIITFGVFMPCSLFIGNSTEFVINFRDVYPLIINVVLITFGILMVAGFILVPDIIFRVYETLIFGLTLGLYIQGNFMNPKFGLLNGSDIDWSKYNGYRIVGIIVWALCVIVPLVMVFVKKKITELVIKCASYLLCAMQLVALVSVLISAGNSKTKVGDCSYALLRKDEFQMSSNENIVVFLVDTLDKDYYEQIIEADPAFEDNLQDFTYYDNCITGSSPTVAAIPLFFTGKLYNDLSVDFSDYEKQAYEESSLFKDLKNNNYKVNLFTESDHVFGATPEEVDNMKGYDKFEITDKKGFTQCLYKFAAFYVMPVALKQQFWFYSDDFDKYVGVIDQNYEAVTFDDAKLYQDFRDQGITLTNDQNVFTFYHMKGCHAPYDIDENMEPVKSGSSTLEQQTQGCFKFIYECIDEMKANGTYDNSTIVITADHGQKDLYQSGTVLVKKKGEQKDYATDSSPVMFPNLRATIASQFLSDYSAYGETLEEVPDEPRERIQTIHMIAKDVFPDNPEVMKHDFSRFAFTGDSKDMSKVTYIPWDDTRE